MLGFADQVTFTSANSCLRKCNIIIFITFLLMNFGTVKCCSVFLQVIAEGQTKLSAVPSGGAIAVAGGSSAAGESKEEAKEEKKEEKKEESEEESDDDMGFGLFD